MDSWYQWWLGLSVAAVLNAALWLLWGRYVVRRAARVAEERSVTRRKLFWLVGFFAAGCLCRSAYSMLDAPQLLAADAWIARVVAARLLGTVADLAFAGQWSLLLRRADAARASRALVPLIGVVELFSWLVVRSIAA